LPEHLPTHAALDTGLTVATVSRSIDNLGLVDIDFITIDAEGHEEHVLAGARKTRLWAPAFWIECEERHNPIGPERLFAALERLGYDGWFATEGRLAPVAGFRAELQSEGRRQGSRWYGNNFALVQRSRAVFDALAALVPEEEPDDR
jgi:hypothetical protein